MALKSFHRETLNDNWLEERGPPLNGVLPRDGMSEFSTTSSIEFADPKLQLPGTKARLINERSLGEALLQSAGADISSSFRSSLPLPNKDQESRHFQTTSRAAFGTPVMVSMPIPRNQAPAGGIGGRCQVRGKSTSGAMGEAFRSNEEPQRDTASQRSWLYSLDPMLAVKHRTAPADIIQYPNKQEPMKVKESDFRRQTTTITNGAPRHGGVFIDDYH